MKKMYLMRGMAALAMGLVVVSCNKMDFSGQPQVSTEEAMANAEMQLGVTIDPNQDWNMTQNVQANISVNMGTGKDYTLIVYDKNPFLFEDAVYFTKQKVSDGSNVRLNLNVPSFRETLYVTLMENDGLNYSMTTLISNNALNAEFTSETSNAPAMRRANVGENYPQTSTGINANANEWADPNKEFGGWLVPDPLTDEQKDVVRQYFQAVPNRTYQDPEWRHFFVQQVYKGATQKPETGNKEVTVAASGTEYTSSNMNLLTVGYNEQHINNFNDGNCSVNGSVLTNGGNVNDGPYHSDQIMLMVNIDDTQCMGYHNTGNSLQRNDKAGLVGWETIKNWANANLGAGKGDCLDDGWNRSFVGFDFELYSLEQSYAKDNGNKIYAPISAVPGNALQYVWDGNNVIARGSASVADVDLTSRFTDLWKEGETKTNNADGSITYNAVQWGGLGAWIGNSIDFSPYQSLVVVFAEATTIPTQIVIDYGDEWGSWGTSKCEAAAGATKIDYDFAGNYLSNLNKIRQVAIQTAENGVVKISRIYLKGKQGEAGYGDYILVNGQKVPFLNPNMNMYGGVQRSLSDSDMKTNKDGKECLNLPAFKALVDEGYLPVKDKDLRTWVKWQGGDGYYSDWIVTLTEAKRAPKQETHAEQPHQNPAIFSYAFEDTHMGDYDMNDIVLKVQENEDGENIDIKLVAAGATLDLNIRLYTYDESGENGYGDSYTTLSYNGETEIHKMLGVDAGTMVNTGAGANANPITIQIPKSGNDPAKLRIAIYSVAQGEMRLAGSGQAPYGVVIPADWKWPRERVNVKNAYNYVKGDVDMSFRNFAENAGQAEEWYNYPTGSVMK